MLKSFCWLCLLENVCLFIYKINIYTKIVFFLNFIISLVLWCKIILKEYLFLTQHKTEYYVTRHIFYTYDNKKYYFLKKKKEEDQWKLLKRFCSVTLSLKFPLS